MKKYEDGAMVLPESDFQPVVNDKAAQPATSEPPAKVIPFPYQPTTEQTQPDKKVSKQVVSKPQHPNRETKGVHSLWDVRTDAPILNNAPRWIEKAPTEYQERLQRLAQDNPIKLQKAMDEVKMLPSVKLLSPSYWRMVIDKSLNPQDQDDF
ncbi:MAG TPA: hypothetical protein VF209_02325 [Patescibacteria group bacterium]